MINTRINLLTRAVSIALLAPAAAFATNGMNMAGYGPISTAMGGTSMAYDHGTAAVMTNPATLGLMDRGHRFDVGLSNLRPSVETKMAGAGSWDSASDSFFMPGIGWVKRDRDLAYGFGMMAQGGMGTEFSSATGAPGGAGSADWITNQSGKYSQAMYPGAVSGMLGATPPNGFGMTDMTADPASGMNSAMTAAVGLTERSEVSMGRIVFPIAASITRELTVGASLDFVWAGMDLQMAMPGNQMGAMMESGAITGSLVNGMNGLMYFDPADTDPTNGMDKNLQNPFYDMGGQGSTMSSGIVGLNYGYFDFTNDSDYTGEATATGFAGKLGMTYKVSPKLTVGATYNSKTSMADMEATGAKVTMNVLWASDYGLDTDRDGNPDTAAAFTNMGMELTGTIKVIDFQWPDSFGIGLSYEVSDQLMIAADVKQIGWASVMKDFKMEFTASDAASNNFGTNMDMRGASMTAVMAQNWDDQTVIALGAAYKSSDELTLRGGLNYAKTPTQDDTLHYLFPAIVETHLTGGVGYQIDKQSSVDFSLSYVPEVEQTNSQSNLTSTMSQANWQVMYSRYY
ncbi:MAG: outer membrane protein transport protein [Gammaproteobacteria bacterium]|nr:outer membrane protein transport protein [Gammaproteobacteria bacterium]